MELELTIYDDYDNRLGDIFVDLRSHYRDALLDPSVFVDSWDKNEIDNALKQIFQETKKQFNVIHSRSEKPYKPCPSIEYRYFPSEKKLLADMDEKLDFLEKAANAKKILKAK